MLAEFEKRWIEQEVNLSLEIQGLERMRRLANRTISAHWLKIPLCFWIKYTGFIRWRTSMTPWEWKWVGRNIQFTVFLGSRKVFTI